MKILHTSTYKWKTINSSSVLSYSRGQFETVIKIRFALITDLKIGTDLESDILKIVKYSLFEEFILKM